LQELPKYLRGYHVCHRDDAARLAALILKARYGDDKAALQAISVGSSVQDVVPRDVWKSQSASEWKRAITAVYTSEAIQLTADDAKMHFLRAAHQWPTFGSAFFEVKQTSDSSLPEKLLIAINKNGVNLIDPANKVNGSVRPTVENHVCAGNHCHISVYAYI
jgi:myosin-7